MSATLVIGKYRQEKEKDKHIDWVKVLRIRYCLSSFGLL